MFGARLRLEWRPGTIVVGADNGTHICDETHLNVERVPA
jgi:hypothetical protein